MKISQEEFDKLPQLDRIEFRLITNEIDKRTDVSGGLSFFILLAIFGFVSAMLMNLLTGKVPISFIQNYLYVIFIYFLFWMIMNIVMAFIHSNLVNKLESKYFNINRKK